MGRYQIIQIKQFVWYSNHSSLMTFSPCCVCNQSLLKDLNIEKKIQWRSNIKKNSTSNHPNILTHFAKKVSQKRSLLSVKTKVGAGIFQMPNYNFTF